MACPRVCRAFPYAAVLLVSLSFPALGGAESSAVVATQGQLLAYETARCEDPFVTWQEDTFGRLPSGLVLLPVPVTLEEGRHDLRVECPDGTSLVPVDVQAGDYRSSQLRVDPRRSGRRVPPRVKSEKAEVAVAYAGSHTEVLWRDPFVVPIHTDRTSEYGVRRTFNRQVRSRHLGVDYDGPAGLPVHASNDGVVAHVADDYYYIGNAVFIDHGWGLYSLYGHLRDISVEPGDRVERGERIGTVGRTGRVTGPHLHFAIKLAGHYIDPESVLGLSSFASEQAPSGSMLPTRR